jgi:hypothetical protein
MMMSGRQHDAPRICWRGILGDSKARNPLLLPKSGHTGGEERFSLLRKTDTGMDASGFQSRPKAVELWGPADIALKNLFAPCMPIVSARNSIWLRREKD